MSNIMLKFSLMFLNVTENLDAEVKDCKKRGEYTCIFMHAY